MTNSRRKEIMRASSRLLQWVGALIFLFGDAFLYEIKHVNFLMSALIGIIGGVLVMLLGAGLAIANKSRDQSSTLD